MAFSVSAGQENIRFQRITLEQGLSQQVILSAFQDQQGYMWFGTQEGLNRFDGYQFKVFTHSRRQKNSLSSDWIYAINEAADGKLWIGTLSGLNVFDKSTQTFDKFMHDPLDLNSISENNIRVIYKDSNQTFWLGTHNGLNKYNPSTNNFTRYFTDSSTKNNIKYHVSTISQDAEGLLWIGTANHGVFRFDPKTETIVTTTKQISELSGFTSQKIRALYTDSQNRLWVGTVGDGLSIIDIDGPIIWSPEQLAGTIISHIYEDQLGTVLGSNRCWVISF